MRGDTSDGFDSAAAVAEGRFETSFVEHAYIEPEAGYAMRVGDRIQITACTQTPYMDRDEMALIMGLKPEQVHIVPTAVGGGFGGKLDLSLQPLIATAAWILNRPVRCIYTRPESMAATPKRHPARIGARFACDAKGKLTAVEFHGDFNTGAYCRSAIPALVARGEDRAACAQLSRWVYVRGRRVPGLVNRRAAERALCERGLS